MERVWNLRFGGVVVHLASSCHSSEVLVCRLPQPWLHSKCELMGVFLKLDVEDCADLVTVFGCASAGECASLPARFIRFKSIVKASSVKPSPTSY